MEKEPYRPGLSKDATLVEQLKELQRNPNSLVFAALGERYRTKGLVRQALEILEEGLSLHPDFASGMVAKARCYFDLRRYADCLDLLEQVLLRNPENIRAEKLRSEVFQRLGQRKAAIGALTRVVSLMPNDRAAVKALEELENLEFPPAEASVVLQHASNDAPGVRGQLEDFRIRSAGEAELSAGIGIASTVKTVEIINENQNPAARSEGNDTAQMDAVAEGWSDEDEAGSESFGDITFATRTIADLYLRQGLKEKAKKVLQLMAERDPNDAWAKETLQKLLPSSGNNIAPQAKRTQLMLKAQYLERLIARVQSVKRVTN